MHVEYIFYQGAQPFSSASDVLNFLHFNSCIKLQDFPLPGIRGTAEGVRKRDIFSCVMHANCNTANDCDGCA
jgi:hypothetical protein